MKSDTLVRDPAFFKRFFSIWSMLVLYNIITLGVNLADNVMIGGYSETAMSGVSAVNQVQFVFQQLMMGIGDGIVVLGSQYWGKKRPDAIRRFLPGAFMLGAAISLLLFVAACVAPKTILAIFTPDPAIQAAGVEYLRVIKYSYLIFAMSQILLAMLRSVETVRIGFWVSLAALAVNITLNYMLIGGHWGAPELGAAGAAIATTASRVMELAVVMLYALKADKKLSWRLTDIFRPDRGLVKDYLRLIRPMLFTSLMFGVSVALQTAILGHMNENAIAANSVASTLFQTLKVASVGAASAASILIGTAIGSGQIGKIKAYTRTLQLMFLGIGLCTSLLLFALRYPILSLYDMSEETYHLAEQFILVLCFTGFGTAYEMPTIIGLIRGGGDAKFAFWNDLINIWVIMIPLSLLAAFVFKWSPVAVICCLNSDQVFKCIPGCIKVNRYTWIKKLTRGND
jgi:putative MATE family efflux protein